MTSNARPESETPRRPYEAPQLRRLGSVRELTLGGTMGGMMDGLVGKKSTNGEYNLIEPGAPERSWVYLKASGDSATVMCTSACGRGKMPPSGSGLTAAQLQALSKWIKDGASKQ